MTQITLSDVLAQETKRNPAAFFAQFRGQEPLVYITDFVGTGDAWVATNYDDVLAILKDPRFLRSIPKVGESFIQSNSTMRKAFAWRQDMLTTDPPDHTRLRGLVSKAFTPRMIEQLQPRIQQITNALLDVVQPLGQMDLINDFAYPLPITVISEMLGIPTADQPRFRVWTQALLDVSAKSEQDTTTISAMEAFIDYIKALIVEKQKHPGDDVTISLVQAEEQGDCLSETELISTIFLLIVAGHETTVNLIGNGTLALLEHPEQLYSLQQDLSSIPSAIEELLRYTPPVTITTRWAREDILLHGKIIRKGQQVVVSLIGANTDARQYTRPEDLDITRQINRHVSFGKGIHYCLGAPLARLEGQIAFSTLLQRLPALRLASDPEQLVWNRAFGLRGLVSLPVLF
jgi:cytochrome P450